MLSNRDSNKEERMVRTRGSSVAKGAPCERHADMEILGIDRLLQHEIPQTRTKYSNKSRILFERLRFLGKLAIT